MQHKNKIIIGIASLAVIVAIGFTIKSNVLVKNNKVVERSGSSESQSKENADFKTENVKDSDRDKEDIITSASQKKESSDKKNVNVYLSKKEDLVSGASYSQKEKVIEGKNIISSLSNRKGAVSSILESAVSHKVHAISGASKEDTNSGQPSGNTQSHKVDVTSSTHKEDTNSQHLSDNTQSHKVDGISSASKEDTNSAQSSGNTQPQTTATSFIDKAINKKATKLVDLGWAKYIVITFNQGNINDYDLYVLDNGNYKSIMPSKVDDSGKIVKWEIDKLGYNTLKVKSKNSGEEGIYKFVK